MDLHEWLNNLVGHRVSITFKRTTAEGILEKIIGNVLVVHDEHYDEPGLPDTLEEVWYIKMREIVRITHKQDDCKKCRLKSPAQSVA